MTRGFARNAVRSPGSALNHSGAQHDIDGPPPKGGTPNVSHGVNATNCQSLREGMAGGSLATCSNRKPDQPARYAVVPPPGARI